MDADVEGRLESRVSLDDEGVNEPLIHHAPRQSPYLSTAKQRLLQRLIPRNVGTVRLSVGFVLVLGLVLVSTTVLLAPVEVITTGSLPSYKNGVCSRILVHKFDSAWGFGSEFSIFLRAAALQDVLSHAVVPDTRDWIYGELSNFWLPLNYTCTLPADVFDQSRATTFGTEGWERRRRVVLSRSAAQLSKLDTLVRKTSIDIERTRIVAQREKMYQLTPERITLPYGETVPDGVEASFLQQSSAMARIARPTPQMQAQMDRLLAKLGLDEFDTAKRAPVVVVQIRLGDKWMEQYDIKQAGSHIEFGDIAPYFDAAQLALRRLYDADITPPPRTFPQSSIKKPILVVMTAESGVVERLQALDAGSQFEIIQSPSMEFTAEEAEEYTRIFEPPPTTSASKTVTASSTTMTSLANVNTTVETTTAPHLLAERWSQGMLYSASLGLRLALTRQLISELTVYATRADAFVVSGNSNLGRLALVLGGEEGTLGLAALRAIGGRVRSIDVPFYPTAYRSAIFPP